jgi:hypothetical protein
MKIRNAQLAMELMKHVSTPGFGKDVHERMTGRDGTSRNDLSQSFFTDKMTINFDMILLIYMFMKKWVVSNVEDCLVIVAPCLYLMKSE